MKRLAITVAARGYRDNRGIEPETAVMLRRLIVRVITAAVSLTVLNATAAGTGAVAAPANPRPCSAISAPGGDWPMYGHDLANSRAQTAESSISAADAVLLMPAWRYDTGHPSTVFGLTDINSTPIVGRGCVYVGDALGDVAALAAETGEVMWRRHIDANAPPSQSAGAIVGSAVIDDDRVKRRAL